MKKGLLVLSRQRDEVICIGDDIEIVVCDLRGDKVRIGVRAPADVPVHRKEIHELILQERAGTRPQRDGYARPQRGGTR